MTLATRGRWPRRIPWERRRAVGLPPLGARARAPPAPQWGPEIARHRLALVACGLAPLSRVAATAARGGREGASIPFTDILHR